MNATRRDLFKFLGGSAVGALFTPAPWRLITDTALWSENWPGIPRPARGEIRARFTNCALCPAGCAVRARCVGDRPVALTGVAAHPLSHGALCPFGLTGHHLPYHPLRLKQGPVKEAAGAVANALAKCGPTERVAVLDLRPGRTASWTHRRAMASVKNGLYLAPPSPLGSSGAFDLHKAKTVLSFGAPLLDGWGTPGNVMAARENFRLIQAEPLESRTASLADLWLPIRPGAEEALAQAIACVLADRKPEEFAAQTGLAEEQIVSVANELANNGPALVLDGGQAPAVMELNRLLGSLGRTIVARREAPVPDAWKKAAPVTSLEAAADGSIRVLLIDESAVGGYLPWGAIEKKLVRDNPLVVTFAWSKEGYGRYAQYVLPTTVYPEVFDDIPPAVDSVVAAFRLATPLVPPPAGMVNPAEFIGGLAGVPAGDALRERADAIHKSGRGTLFTCADAKSTPLREVKPADFWKALNEGGCWLDAADEKAGSPQVAFPEFSAGQPAEESAEDLPLVAITCETRAAAVPLSPLMSKLYQESHLGLAANHAALHPATARACGLKDGARATLQTRCGTSPIEVSLDSGVPPGVVQVAAGAEILDLCGGPGGRPARAKVVPA
ncbi:MAG: molybdopterin dinucleotide binding domain-containing protein [Bryobacteraceae bacterium]|jgi:anaerobic selenocysteine-containing dehydrogenase